MLNWGKPREVINAWWERLPGERYWLDVTDRVGRDRLLAAPRGEGRRADTWTHRLITHVGEGDVVFRYDASDQAIVGWAITQGRAEKRSLAWSRPVASSGHAPPPGEVPSWAVDLHRSVRLEIPVPLCEIARVQWGLFPSLRVLEDMAGYPLYYPFEMGQRDTTHALPGFVFKLPAVFVQGVPALARAAASVARPVVQPAGAPSRSAEPAPIAQAATR